jgi:uncharacterized protein
MNLAAIVAEILTGYPLPARGFHGVVHWARVLENGLKLAESTGARVAVVQLFAVFHDSRRENDGTDPEHGRRGADLAATLRGRLFDLPDADFMIEFVLIGDRPEIGDEEIFLPGRVTEGRVGVDEDIAPDAD